MLLVAVQLYPRSVGGREGMWYRWLISFVCSVPWQCCRHRTVFIFTAIRNDHE